MRETAVSDLSPLSSLPNLASVDATDSQVSDLTPLLENPAFGDGDFLHLGGCPLTAEALCEQIPELEARGVTVLAGGATCQSANATDTCASTPLSLVENTPVGGTLAGFSPEAEATCDMGDEGDVWAVYIPAADGAVLFDVCDSETPIHISVFQGCGGAEVFCATYTELCSATPPPFQVLQGELLAVRIAAAPTSVGQFALTVTNGTAEGEGEGIDENALQSADQDGDYVINLSELLRVIQFYNSLGCHCAANPLDTEDGFEPGPGAKKDCAPYDTDYQVQDWVISLSELLRVIQFYNSLGYHYCPLDATEDGFCPGAA